MSERLQDDEIGLFVEVDGVLRPVLNSKGLRIASTPEAIRNFWRWFGDGSAVDHLGRPLVLYHGTQVSEDFDAFDRIVTFLAESSEYASRWAGVIDRSCGIAINSRVMPVYVALRAPVDLTAGAGTFDPTSDPQVMFYDHPAPEYGGPAHSGVDAVRALQAANFDGAYWVAGQHGRNFVAFDPRQIKSAVGNSGRFDIESASLTDEEFEAELELERLRG